MFYSLPELFEKLDAYGEPIPFDELKRHLENTEIDWDIVEPYLRFNPERYTRNLMHAGDYYHALILCWQNGQRSPIHDHRGSACCVRVLKGTGVETKFETTPNGLVVPTTTSELPEGAVCSSLDSDTHQISNLQAEGDLVTMHLYSPPLLVMGEYSVTSPKVTEFCDPVFEFSLGSGI